MITAEQKLKLKAVLKNGYTKQVRNNLIKKNILNRNGNPYRMTLISEVMNGKFSNSKIEEAIFELYLLKEEELRMITQRRNEIFNLNEQLKFYKVKNQKLL